MKNGGYVEPNDDDHLLVVEEVVEEIVDVEHLDQSEKNKDIAHIGEKVYDRLMEDHTVVDVEHLDQSEKNKDIAHIGEKVYDRLMDDHTVVDVEKCD
jgi:hypothetical protein